jgi:hypothetical protein
MACQAAVAMRRRERASAALTGLRFPRRRANWLLSFRRLPRASYENSWNTSRHQMPMAGCCVKESVMCNIDGCQGKAVGRGLCAKHYMRARRNGDQLKYGGVRAGSRHRYDVGARDRRAR